MDGNNRCKSTRKRRSVWFCRCLSEERERKTNDSEGHLCENRRQRQGREHLPMHCDLVSIVTFDDSFVQHGSIFCFTINWLILECFYRFNAKQKIFYQTNTPVTGTLIQNIADQSTIQQEIHINKTLKNRDYTVRESIYNWFELAPTETIPCGPTRNIHPSWGEVTLANGAVSVELPHRTRWIIPRASHVPMSTSFSGRKWVRLLPTENRLPWNISPAGSNQWTWQVTDELKELRM